MAELLHDWRALAAKVDAFFARVHQRHGEAMACRAGCASCCQQELSVLPVEALAIGEQLASLVPREKERVAARGRGAGPPCAFLDTDGRCAIYAARPIVCRSHGVPIREQELDGSDADRQRISVCPLNFTASVPSAAVLDGTALIATLAVVDSLARQKLGISDPVRIPLRQLACEGLAALDPPG